MEASYDFIDGKYEILEKIREGGMGAVYKVRHRLLDEVRVIKLIRSQFQFDEDVKARFAREARMAIKLRHPNIAQLYDFSVDSEANAFIVMEYVDGLTLQDLQRSSGLLPVGLMLELACQTLAALGYLHRKGIVHRDISPDNLMVTGDDEGRPFVKLIDLGVAKVLAATSGFTQAGTFLGKVRYAAPEQFRAEEGAVVDERSDLYSLGVVLYEQFTGRHPIAATTISGLVAGHLFDQPTPFSQSDPSGRLPAELRAALLRALAKLPAERFESAENFSAVLSAISKLYPLASGGAWGVPALRAMPSHATLRPNPDSTQDRLDKAFRAEPTPPPEPTPTLGSTPTLLLDETPERIEQREDAAGERDPSTFGPDASISIPSAQRVRRTFLVALGIAVVAAISYVTGGAQLQKLLRPTGPSPTPQRALEPTPSPGLAPPTQVAPPPTELPATTVVPPATEVRREAAQTAAPIPLLTPVVATAEPVIEPTELPRGEGAPATVARVDGTRVTAAPSAAPSDVLSAEVIGTPSAQAIAVVPTESGPASDSSGGVGLSKPLDLKDVDRAPQLIDFPPNCLAQDHESVTLRIVVNERGTVDEVQVTSPSNKRSRAKCAEVWRKARYKPALKNGAAVKVWMTVTISSGFWK